MIIGVEKVKVVIDKRTKVVIEIREAERKYVDKLGLVKAVSGICWVIEIDF